MDADSKDSRKGEHFEEKERIAVDLAESNANTKSEETSSPLNYKTTIEDDAPLPPKSPYPRGHRKNVSWGHASFSPPPPPPYYENVPQNRSDASAASLKSPDLNRDFSAGTGSSPSRRPSRREVAVGERIDLEDVVSANPLETEAETYIMKALEIRDPTTAATARPRSDTVTSILSSVPDEAIRAFAANAGVGPDDSAAAAAAEIESCASQVSSERIQSQSLRPTSQSSRPGSKASLAARHHRSQTLEQQLFGLATAIGTMHEQQLASMCPPEHPAGRKRLNSVDFGGPDQAAVVGSADALLQNASILARRGAKQDGKSADAAVGEVHDVSELDSTSASTAGSRRRILKTGVRVGALVNHKKTDQEVIVEDALESEPEQEDEEQGAIAGGDDGKSDELTPAMPEGNGNGRIKFPYADKILEEWQFVRDFQDFFALTWKKSIVTYLKVALLYLMVPATATAAILFHFAGNPPTGVVDRNASVNGTLVNTDGEPIDSNSASASWWILFFVRQLITFSLALGAEVFIIDFLSIRTGVTIKVAGPWLTLFILQARGWPFIVFCWGLLDFALLAGSRPFFSHWAFWQSTFKLFNRSNPSGMVVASVWNHRVLATAVSVGAVVAIKRFWLGLYLGRQTYAQFSEKLATVMRKILLISQVASLGFDFEKYVMAHENREMKAPPPTSLFGISHDQLRGLMVSLDEDSVACTRGGPSSAGHTDVNEMFIDTEDRNPLTGSLSYEQQAKIEKLLGAWEEPTIKEQRQERMVSVSAILQFRRSLSLLRGSYPFGGYFGPADTREACIESSQETYLRLLLRTPNSEALDFEILALLGVDRDGNLDHTKLKEMIRLFRPDRDGRLSLIDFVKSIDQVYRELRLLRAGVANASKIDFAFEGIINIVFYNVMIIIILGQLGLDPLSLFLAISGFIVAFAFMIGSASSKYFEGLLFILVRRPYAIGDAVHCSNVEQDTSFTGSPWWMVEDVSLFTTSVVYLFTGERASLSNGSLANSRIINSTRSPHAWLYILLKFHIDVEYKKVQIFHSAIEQFIRNRPREWLALTSFRALRVEADQGFVEYIVVAQHRDSWANWLAIHTSKADLASFALELSKKLDIRFKSPPLPVDLSMVNPVAPPTPPGGIPDNGSVGSDMGYSTDLSRLQALFAPQLNSPSQK